jgi:hypothetical protein
MPKVFFTVPLGPMVSVPSLLSPTYKVCPTFHVGVYAGYGFTTPVMLTWALRGLRAVNSRAASRKIRGLIRRSSPNMRRDWWLISKFFLKKKLHPETR